MASGKITGVTTGTSASKYNYWVEWRSTAFAIGNYSLVTATAYLQRNDGYASSAYNLDIAASNKYITVAGTKKTSSQKGIDTRNSAKVIIATAKDIKVSHEDTGYKTINISSAFPRLTSNLSGGSLSKEVTLDKIDVSLPSFGEQPIVFSEITQTTVNVSFTSNDTLDKIQYSLDNQKTWVEVNSKTFQIKNLNPNNNYTIYIKIRKKSNQKTKTSSASQFKTLPTYVTDIVVDDEIHIDVGSLVALNYNIYPSNASIKTLNIESSNNSVVSVDGNNLIALVKGTATITLTAQDGSGISKSVNVLTIQRVEGIITNQDEIVLPKTSSVELQYTVLPKNADNKNVFINSSDESIVMVEGNEIIGVENGNAIITITTEDGNYEIQIPVSVFGDYVWYDYSKPLEILNDTDVQHINSNIITIRSMLLLKEYEVEQLKTISDSKNTPLNNIFDLLQNIEYNLDVINDNDAKSIYYIEPKAIGNFGSNKEDIWRWLQILNEMYDILSGSAAKWQYLLCIDGYPTIDGEKILVRGDIIG